MISQLEDFQTKHVEDKDTIKLALTGHEDIHKTWYFWSHPSFFAGKMCHSAAVYMN